MNHVVDQDSTASGYASLSSQRYQMMLQFIQSQMTKTSTLDSDQSDSTSLGMVLSTIGVSDYNSTWIFYSGASAHICYDITKFATHTKLQNKHLTLPNGTRVPVTSMGTMILSPTLTLHNILFIPSFCVNLVSMN